MKIPTNASWAELWRGGNWAHVTRKPELGHVLPVLLTCFASKYQTVLTDGKYSLQLRTSWISHEVQLPLNIKQSDGKHMGGVKFSLQPIQWEKKILNVTWSATASSHVPQLPQMSNSRSLQGGRSWRAIGDRQISLGASAERAFANFCNKKHRILQLQFFAKNCNFLHENRHFRAATLISDDVVSTYFNRTLKRTQ